MVAIRDGRVLAQQAHDELSAQRFDIESAADPLFARFLGDRLDDAGDDGVLHTQEIMKPHVRDRAIENVRRDPGHQITVANRRGPAAVEKTREHSTSR
jgi:hypothetical protein